MNSSNILANRTRNLIQDIKPDTVCVQTNEKWWRGASKLGHVKSQEEMDLAAKELSHAFDYELPLNSRQVSYKAKWAIFNALWKWNYALPMEYNPFTPGLEVKFAVEEAEKLNSNVVYLGYEIDPNTKRKLYHETRFSLLKTFVNMFRMKNAYKLELLDYYIQMTNYGTKKFIESSCDQYFINW